MQNVDFTFHRAFDMVRSQGEALEALVSCGVRRVLTSGGSQTALQVMSPHPKLDTFSPCDTAALSQA